MSVGLLCLDTEERQDGRADRRATVWCLHILRL